MRVRVDTQEMRAAARRLDSEAEALVLALRKSRTVTGEPWFPALPLATQEAVQSALAQAAGQHEGLFALAERLHRTASDLEQQEEQRVHALERELGTAADSLTVERGVRDFASRCSLSRRLATFSAEGVVSCFSSPTIQVLDPRDWTSTGA